MLVLILPFTDLWKGNKRFQRITYGRKGCFPHWIDCIKHLLLYTISSIITSWHFKTSGFTSGSLLVLLPVASGFTSGFGLKTSGLLPEISGKPEVFKIATCSFLIVYTYFVTIRSPSGYPGSD